jgi:hypothetical protein
MSITASIAMSGYSSQWVATAESARAVARDILTNGLIA